MDSLRGIVARIRRGRRKAPAVGEPVAPPARRQGPLSIEERIAERGITDMARREPEAARWFVMTDAERRAERARRATRS